MAITITVLAFAHTLPLSQTASLESGYKIIAHEYVHVCVDVHACLCVCEFCANIAASSETKTHFCLL